MKPINATAKLEHDIVILEEKQSQQLKELKDQFHITYESMKPINLIKNTFKDVTQTPDVQNNLKGAAVGAVSGFLLKKLLFSSAGGPLARIAGMAVQTLATNIAAKNSDKIIDSGKGLLQNLVSKFVGKKKVIPDTNS